MSERPYVISAPLKRLLRTFGEVQATMGFYAKARLPYPVENPGGHYPGSDLLPGEPALLVKIAKDGELRIASAVNDDGSSNDDVKVMELPEDEFWFFEAFRPALTRLNLGAPGFLFEMALVNLYGVFEAYLSEMARQRLRRFPALLSGKAKRDLERVDGQAPNLGLVIDQEVRRITFGSIGAFLAYLRGELGLVDLTAEHDVAVQTVALVRNCLLHAGGYDDQRLAAADPAYGVGSRLGVGETELTVWAKALRDLAYAIDRTRDAPAGP